MSVSVVLSISVFLSICVFLSTHGRKIERDEAPKVLAPPPTGNLAEWNFVLKVVVSD